MRTAVERYLKLPAVPDALAVLSGSVLVLAGSVVLFAANPAMSFGPVFGVSSVEPVSVMVNMAVGASAMAAGGSVAVPRLDGFLWVDVTRHEMEE